MSHKVVCDACGKDMTEDPGAGRLAFTLERPFEAHANPTYKPLVRVRVDVTVRVGASGEFSDGFTNGDVCAACVQNTVAQGQASDIGPVTR